LRTHGIRTPRRGVRTVTDFEAERAPPARKNPGTAGMIAKRSATRKRVRIGWNARPRGESAWGHQSVLRIGEIKKKTPLHRERRFRSDSLTSKDVAPQSRGTVAIVFRIWPAIWYGSPWLLGRRS